MSLVGTKRNRDRKGIGYSPLNITKANLEDAQVAAVMAIDKMT